MFTLTSQISSAGFTSKLSGQMARVRNATLLVLAILILALPGITLADSPLQEDAPGQVAEPIQYAVVIIKPRRGTDPSSGVSYCRINSNWKFVVKLKNIGDVGAPPQRVGVSYDTLGGGVIEEKFSPVIPPGESRRVVFALPPNGQLPKNFNVGIYHSGRYFITAQCFL